MIEIASNENPEMVFFEGDIEDDQVLKKSLVSLISDHVRFAVSFMKHK